MRDTRWGTRASTVEHASIDQDLVTALPPEGAHGRRLAAA
jgi:hypothetical protein